MVKNLRVNFIQPSYLFDELKVSTYYEKNSYTSVNLIQFVTLKKVKLCEIYTRLVWIDGKLKKPLKIPSDIISRFKSLEVV